MSKLLCLLTILALTFTAVGGFAANKARVYKYVPKTTSGKPITGFIKFEGHDPASMAQFKSQNHLTKAMNAFLTKEKTLHKASSSYNNGSVDTVPYFNSWFITGGHNSVYTYSMVGHNPTAGGTTGINNQIIPLISVLEVGGVPVYVFDPTAATDPEGDDISLTAQSPLYDATTTYAGPPVETGQYVDSHQRVSFRTTAAANWHTPLNPPMSSGIVWIQFLEWNNGDWACIGLEAPPCTSFPVFNIDTISNNFSFILSVEAPANSTVPIIVTDWLTAFQGGNPQACCVLGFHTAQPGIVNPAGILVWTWSTFIPHNADNGFTNPFAGGFGYDNMVMSHEVDELYNDPFVNTAVSPWVDGSVSFAQGNLETGDAIEAMNAVDVITNVPLNTGGGPYTYHMQNVPTLEWFTRNPFNGGIYSWPNEHTLSQAPHPAYCATPPPPMGNSPCWKYGEGSGAFFFGPPY